jgi:hypothetical protein
MLNLLVFSLLNVGRGSALRSDYDFRNRQLPSGTLAFTGLLAM